MEGLYFASERRQLSQKEHVHIKDQFTPVTVYERLPLDAASSNQKGTSRSISVLPENMFQINQKEIDS